MKAIVFDNIGLPTEVLELREVSKPVPAKGEVLVKMLNSSINQGDFLFIQSLYPDPKKPSLPGQIAGNTGAGIVVEKGPDATLAEGTLVAIYYYNTWAEYAAIPEKWLIPLPSDYPLDQAGQLMSVITAWDLITLSKAQRGEWIAITAGNASSAITATQIAKRKKLRVISLVRKQPPLDLFQLGADEVIDLSITGIDLITRIREITGGAGVSAVIDAVGGPALPELIRSTKMGGKVILYGGMSEQYFELHNNDVYLNGITIESYIYRHFFQPPSPEEAATIREIIDLTRDPSFIVPVSGKYELDEHKTAVLKNFYSMAGSRTGS